MDQKIVGAIGAIAGLAALDSAAQATPAVTPNPGNLNARSFAELLDPIPNAVAALRAADAAAARETQAVSGQAGEMQVAGMHHHHHRYRHHHHHHHHHRVLRGIIRHLVPHRHHHHHHHHHLSSY